MHVLLRNGVRVFVMSCFITVSLVAMDENKEQERALMRRMHQLSVSSQSKIRILPAHGRFKESQIDLSETDPIFNETYEELCKQAESEERDYVIAQYDVDKGGDEFAVFVDAYVLNRFLWKANFIDKPSECTMAIGKKDFANRTIMSPIQYFALHQLADEKFYYVGSDYHLCAQNGNKDLMYHFFRANYPFGFFGSGEVNKDALRVIRQTSRANVGVCYGGKKRFEEALYWLKKSLEDPADTEMADGTELNIAYCYVEQKEYVKALKVLKRLLTKCSDPEKQRNALRRMANILWRQEEYEDAKTCMLQALDLNPIGIEKGELLHDIGVYLSKVKDSEGATQYGTQSAKLFLALADEQYQAKNLQAARELYAKAENQSWINVIVLSNTKYKLARCCYELGDFQTAEKYCLKLLDKKNPSMAKDFVGASILLHKIHGAHNKPHEAKQVLLDALECTLERKVNTASCLLHIYDELLMSAYVHAFFGADEAGECEKWSDALASLALEQGIAHKEANNTHKAMKWLLRARGPMNPNIKKEAVGALKELAPGDVELHHLIKEDVSEASLLLAAKSQNPLIRTYAEFQLAQGYQAKYGIMSDKAHELLIKVANQSEDKFLARRAQRLLN